MSRGKRVDLFNQDFGEMKDFFQNSEKLPSEHKLKIRIEKRRGKIVTVIEQFQTPLADQKELLKELKKRFSSGGALKDGTIEIQGNFEAESRVELKKKGFNFR